MRFYSEDVIAVIDIGKGNSSVSSFAKRYADCGRVLMQESGEMRSLLVVSVNANEFLYFCNLKADTVKHHLNEEGFIFI